MDLVKTTYLGLELRNPVIAGASSLTANIDSIRKIEAAGAGAIVIKSLFEEQVRITGYKQERELHAHDEINAEMVKIFPEIREYGPEEHLYWVKKTRGEVSLPLIASLNALTLSVWTEWSRKLAECGVDALELNFYHIPGYDGKNADEIENEQLRTVTAVKQAVTVPVSVKISPYYTSPLGFVQRLAGAGADGVVLFNRLFEPEIDIAGVKNVFPFNLSSAGDYRHALRNIGLLAGKTGSDLCGSTGIMQGEDVVKLLLAGAAAVQVVSALYRFGIDHIKVMLNDIETWMRQKRYENLDGFRGKLSEAVSRDPWLYKRSQYVTALMCDRPTA